MDKKELKEVMEKIEKHTCESLKKHADRGYQSIQDVDAVQKLTDTYKNIKKIEMLEEQGGQSEGSYDGSYDGGSMYSERRGRGRYARRDSMGRYSRDGGSNDSSYGSYASYGSSYARGYSRDESDQLMTQLGEMMQEANSEEREVLKETMRKLEKL